MRLIRAGTWAIAGWRNVIPGYSINGAVTEINAECVAALRAASHLAQNIGEESSDADDFAGASREIARAMDEHLLNPQNGLYYLNVDVDGCVHTDVTGDQIFPVMFRVCDEDTGFRVISRLNAPDFWTPGGLRTISQDDPLYRPEWQYRSARRGVAGPHVVVRVRCGPLPSRIHGSGPQRIVQALHRGSQEEQYGPGPV